MKIKLTLIASSIITLHLFSQNSRIWATYYGGGDGGAGDDYGFCTTTDAAGNIYLAGTTRSSVDANCIAFGGFQNIWGGGYVDAFLVKFDSNGNRLWGTYYGGDGDDRAYSIATDGFGNIYMAGSTNSNPGIIAAGGFQNGSGGGLLDAFLVKFNATTGTRIWATFYGGPEKDEGFGVATDISGDVYLAGTTTSTVNISAGGFQNIYGGGTNDAFLVKFNGTTAGRTWATYYGGPATESGNSVATDAFGNVYLAGITSSTINIAFGGFQNVIGGTTSSDAFVVKFNAAAGTRTWATYYGGTKLDKGSAVAVDISGNIYLAGSTNSNNAIGFNGFQNAGGGLLGNNDAFLVKFDASCSRLWATYYGDIGANENGNSVITDQSGNVYLTGLTTSSVNIAFNGFQNINGGGTDAFLVKFDVSGNRIWGTYYGAIGGNVGDYAMGVVTDASGNIYIAGSTSSLTDIAAGGFQNIYGGGNLGGNAFLVKFDSSGDRTWGTYYGGRNGGPGGDYAHGVATDIHNNVYLVGHTESGNGIADGGFQNNLEGVSDVFLAKFDENGNRLWGTYYGETGVGYGEDAGYGVTTDNSGNVYLAGSTYSNGGIATPGGFQNAFGGEIDAFLAKFDENGNRLWATYYGGMDAEYYASVATDNAGNVYLSGYTRSNGLAAGGFQNAISGGTDAFLVKFDANGNRLWATYYGYSGNDKVNSIAADASGNIYMAGTTDSNTGISAGGFQNGYGGLQDAFLVKFDADGNRLWATYYGDIDYEFGYDIATDISGNVYLSGLTESFSGIAFNGFQNAVGGGGAQISNQDAFLVKFDANGNRLWATYYGGTSVDIGYSVATDSWNNVYLAGDTYSAAGNIANGGYQNNLNQDENFFLAKFDSSGNRLCATYYGEAHSEGGHIAVDKFANVYMAGWVGNTSDMTSGGFQNTFGGGEVPVHAWDAFLVKFTSCGSLNAAVTSTDIQCNGKCNGIGEANGIAGSSPYTYSWSNGKTTQTISGLCAGTYTVIITDFTNATFTNTITIIEPAALSATIAATNPLCNGKTGNATANGIGGNSSYSYEWSNGQINQTASGLAAGTHTVIVTDNVGCITNATVTITEPSVLSAITSISNPVCFGDSVHAAVNGTGGTPSYSYAWSGGQITSTVTIAAGTYTVLITDNNGCIKTTTVVVTQPEEISINTTSSPSACIGQTGIATATVSSGGTAPFTYNWSDPNGQTTQIATALAAGVYTATVMDANGCMQTQTVTVTSNNSVTLTVTSTQAGCTTNIGSATANANGGSNPYIYNWNTNPIQTTQTILGLGAGTYTVTITDGNGCTQIQSVVVTATTIQPTVIVNATKIKIVSGDSTQLNIITLSGIEEYQWTPSTGLSCTNCLTPIAKPLIKTNYCVEVTDSNGCTNKACITIDVEKFCEEIFIPTAFSPNDDKENDLECVFGNCIKNMIFIIYDRWGEKVFETTDQTKCWNGTYTNKLIKTTVFAYRLQATLLNGGQIIKTGNISLIE